jgi:hypothetical protein
MGRPFASSRVKTDEQPIVYGTGTLATRTSAQPQQKHNSQANARPQNVQDDIVDVCSSIAPPCSREELEELDADRKSSRDPYPTPEVQTPSDQWEQDAEREKEKNITLCVVQAEESVVRTPGQDRGRTGQRCQIGMQLYSHHRLGVHTRRMVRAECGRRKAAEIEDERQEQGFASERQRVTVTPKAI